MSEAPKSTLNQIYHMANPYGLEPADRVDSAIVGLDVVSGPDGYKISTEVGFMGEGTFGGMTISVKADGGIMNEDGVLRGAEVGKSAIPGMLAFKTEHVEVDELSALLGEPAPTQMQIRIVEPPRQEALYLPGEPGFTLFRELHGKIGRVAHHVRAVAQLLEVEPSPVFSYKQSSGSASYNRDDGTVTYSLRDQYGLGVSASEIAELVEYGYEIPNLPDRRHMVEMGMELTVPKGTEWSKEPSYNRAIIYDAADYRLLHRYPQLTGDAIMRTDFGTGIGDVPDIFPAFNALRRSLADLHNADTTL
jgi:hypothetical protein